MTIEIRAAKRGDGKQIVLINRRAIHEIACADYSSETLAAWGPPVTDEEASEAGAAMDDRIEIGEICIVAEIGGIIAGYGEITPEKNQVHAVYVNPDF